MFCIEVIDPQEEPDTTGGLTADRGTLIGAISAGEQDAGLTSRWPHHDPPFRAPVVRQRWRVLDELEAECVDEVGDRWVVLIDHDRDQVDEHHRNGTPIWQSALDASEGLSSVPDVTSDGCAGGTSEELRVLDAQDQPVIDVFVDQCSSSPGPDLRAVVADLLALFDLDAMLATE